MQDFTDEATWLAIVLGIIICWAPIAPAGASEETADGCETLAGVIAESVDTLLADRYGGARSTLLQSHDTEARAEPLLGCGTVAATTSRAYSAAFRRAGLGISWNAGNAGGEPGGWPPDAVEFCLSHYLDQCYPSLADGAVTRADSQLVVESWSGIRSALRRAMPFGVRSDYAWFRVGQLLNALAISIDASRARPLQVSAALRPQ